MDIDQTLVALTHLPVEQRLRVVATVWDSLSAEEPIELSPAQQQEIDRRVAAHEADPSSALTWDEVRDRV